MISNQSALSITFGLARTNTVKLHDSAITVVRPPIKSRIIAVIGVSDVTSRHIAFRRNAPVAPAARVFLPIFVR